MPNWDEQSPEMQIFWARIFSRRLYVVGGVVLLVLASAALGALSVGMLPDGGAQASETFRFIALLIIFMTALATSAAVYAGLRMGNAGEAFGLPAGSIRALLAIGIMILFVVFGLPLVSPQPGSRLQPVTVIVPRQDLQQAVQLHRDQGLDVVVLDYGREAQGAPGTPGATPEVAARMRVSGDIAARSPEELDISKQLVTAIITLLTTVIGFYFGSRSATDGMKEAENIAQGGDTTDLAVQRRQIGDEFESIKTDLLAKGQVLDSGKDAPEPADTAQAAERKAALERAMASRQAIESKRDEVTAFLAAADEALTAWTAASAPDVRQVHERTATDNLKKAKDALEALKAAQSGYAEEIEAFVQSNAVG